MPLTVDLPAPINQELAQESQREGVSEMEHAALLLCLASAFKQGEPLTPFQNAVRDYLTLHSLDAERVFSAFEDLVRICLDVHDMGKASDAFQNVAVSRLSDREYDFLKHWRNSFVHQSVSDRPVDMSPDLALSFNLPLDSTEPAQGRTVRGADSEQEVTDPKEHVLKRLTRWQAEDNTPLRPPVPTRPGETSTQALFRKWEEEDSQMTEEERAAEDRLWEEIEQGIQENGRVLQLRQLSR